MQARAAKTGGTDKLSQNLAAQKKAGMKGALEQASEENRRQRENDAVAEARNWS
jgi:predicted FMN-binding regulatory protein PaiB